MNSRQPAPARSTQVRWLIVMMLMLLATLGHFNRVSISVAGSEQFIKEGWISNERMGQVYTAFLLVYTACMLPAGWLIDRFGPVNALACMAAGMGFCVVLTGLVGWQYEASVQMWLPLIAVRGLAGALSSPLHPGAARTIQLWIPPVSRSWANGLVTAGALLGIAASYPVFGWLMDQLGWQWAFIACGVGMMLFAVIWYSTAADHAGDHAWTNGVERALVSRDHLPGQMHARATIQEFMRLFRQRGLLLLSLSYAALSYFQYLFFYWIEFYFNDTLQLPVLRSRQASSVVMISMAAGMACGGWLTDWLSRSWGPRAGRRTIAVGGMLLSSLFGVLGVATDEWVRVVIWFALALAALGMCEGVFWTSVTEIGGRTGGLSAAFLNTLGNGGGALAPWITPVLMRRFNWPVAIGVACGVCSLGGLLWFCFDPARFADGGRESFSGRGEGGRESFSGRRTEKDTRPLSPPD
jgi:MFS family permease